MFGLHQLISKKGLVGVEFLAAGIAVAADNVTGRARGLDCAEFLSGDMESATTDLTGTSGPSLSTQTAKSLLKAFVVKHGLEKRNCHVVLKPADYQLLLVDAPDVPDAEMREAIRWRIKDLISIPVAHAAIDIFNLPRDAHRAGKRMLYVVVADVTYIKSLIDIVRDAGLKLLSIDIGELAIRNLMLLAEPERTVAMVRVRQGGGCVAIYRNGDLYLSRQFQLKYNAGLLDDLPDESLALEIQRSLDYFERQMGQAPPACIYLCGDSVSDDKITQSLMRGLNVPIKFFELHKVLFEAASAQVKSNTPHLQDNRSDHDLDEGMLQLSIAALGALYRKEVV